MSNNGTLTIETLIDQGLSLEVAEDFCKKINAIAETHTPEQIWLYITKNILTPAQPFSLHRLLFSFCYPQWQDHPETAPAYLPDAAWIKTTNLYQSMMECNFKTVRDFHTWSSEHYLEFWQYVIDKLNIVFHKKPQKICDLQAGVESPSWFPDATLNIAESCFTATPEKIAIIYWNSKKQLQQMTYGELNQLSNRIANSLIQQNFTAGDAIAINMPMTKEAVAIYLGIIKMGGVVVSVADSFSPEEIATRLRITQAKAVFTQDFILRGEKQLPLYEKVISANAPKTIVLPSQENISCTLRSGDIDWKNFLVSHDKFSAKPCDPMAPCNILFSSGTTGDPKGISWNHTTPIKAASDAFFHQNIQENDVLAWPTNLGWMMGPWLVFAALINRATLALYHDVPRERAFGEFIQDAKVTMLGIVPTLVATWRQSGCMENLNWQTIKVFTSTGECSNPEDMLYLMSLGHYKPIIEYCGGTEIGGSYITSTVIENNYPSLFTTPAMGSNFVLLNEEKQICNDGEVALISPSIGLSTYLLNADHKKVYFADMPNIHNKTLRRHGDHIQHLSNDCYTILGRMDDTMNLGGIKVSSAEIERVLTGINQIIETAAIAISPPHGGPSQLIIYAATTNPLDKTAIKKIMQQRINSHLNPLFKIHDIVFINELPKTASNKIMRRVLRSRYIAAL
jgi:acetyl-CoA synthetase